MRRVPMVLVVCLAMMAMTAAGFAATTKSATPAKTTAPSMATFLIESPHTEQECLSVMDAVEKSKELSSWEFGCMAGNHTAYRMVKAKDEAAALAMVPAMVRDRAHAYKLTKMTPEALASAHKEHM